MVEPNERIAVTHTGSLPRSHDLATMLRAAHRGAPVEPDAFRAQASADLASVIAAQLEAGIDVGNDGEVTRIAFHFYVTERLSGFGGTSNRRTMSDLATFPKFAQLKAARGLHDPSWFSGATADTVVEEVDVEPAAVGPIAYDPARARLVEELELFEAALDELDGPRGFSQTFMTAASPGIITTAHLMAEDDPPYASDAEYVFAVADAMRVEYEAVVAAGHVLQLDAPDLAMERAVMFQDRPLSDFLDRVALHIEAINRATVNIPPDRIRLHACWGNYDGPHVDDVDLGEILPLLYAANVGTYVLPFANPRHQHDWKQIRRHPLPAGRRLVGGVIDTTTNYVEHPEVVADRLGKLAEVVEPLALLAGADCGFSSVAGMTEVAEDVAYAKLRALAEGARLASERLF